MNARLIHGFKRRIARARDAGRRALAGRGRIAAGPGRGLRFDAGRHTRRFESGDYELPVQKALASLVKPGYVCYDVGANLGFFSVLLSHFTGSEGVVYAFEPVPANAEMVEKNVQLNRQENVTVLRIALSRADGTGELLLAAHHGGAVLSSAGTPPDLAGRMQVGTASVDSLVERRRLSPPDLVKLDVEGAEMEVLEGMLAVIRRWGPTLVLELDDETLEKCEAKVSACQKFLIGLGYSTELLANSYPEGPWYVRHFVARRAAG